VFCKAKRFDRTPAERTISPLIVHSTRESLETSPLKRNGWCDYGRLTLIDG
jgi:hypothetical protein